MRAGRPVAATLAVALALAGCGLEIVAYLHPPGDPALAGDLTPQFELNYTSENNQDEFYGFEVYYKFYLQSASVEQNITTQAGLAAAKFLPVFRSDDTLSNHDRPLIEVLLADHGTTPFRSILDFNGVGSSSPDTAATGWYDYDGVVSGKQEVGIRRQGASALEQFRLSDFSEDDPDLADLWSEAQSSGNVVIAMYGLSFGWQNLSSPLYSPAVYLGSTTIYW